MNNEIKIFENEQFGQVRTIEEDGKILFCGSDCAKALGYAKPQNAIATHCRYALKRGIPTKQGNMAEMSFIPEGDLYRLITHSKLPSAEKFESWVFDEVLPSIRRTGGYIMDRQAVSDIELFELSLNAIKENRSRIEEVNTDLQEFKEDMPLLGVEESRITCAVRKKGVSCLGGKNSAAYRDLSTRGRVYAGIYGNLKREFGVGSYKAIKRNQCGQAVKLIEGYEMPGILAERVETLNNQMEPEG